MMTSLFDSSYECNLFVFLAGTIGDCIEDLF